MGYTPCNKPSPTLSPSRCIYHLVVGACHFDPFLVQSQFESESGHRLPQATPKSHGWEHHFPIIWWQFCASSIFGSKKKHVFVDSIPYFLVAFLEDQQETCSVFLHVFATMFRCVRYCSHPISMIPEMVVPPNHPFYMDFFRSIPSMLGIMYGSLHSPAQKTMSSPGRSHPPCSASTQPFEGPIGWYTTSCT